MKLDILRATREELGEANTLLEASGLRVLPTNIHLSDVMVGREAGRIVGVMALEVTGRRGLTLWAAVSAEHRRQGVGTSLLRSLISRAQELGLRDLYAIPGEAAPFFTNLGFVPVAADAVPGEVRSLRSWRDRPEAADGILCLVLETRV